MKMFVIPKIQFDVYATLKAYGLAYLVSCLLNCEESDEEKYVILEDKNSHYQITIPDAFLESYQEDITLSYYYDELLVHFGVDIEPKTYQDNCLVKYYFKKSDLASFQKIGEIFLKEDNSENIRLLLSKYNIENIRKSYKETFINKTVTKANKVMNPMWVKGHRDYLGKMNTTTSGYTISNEDYFLASIGIMYYYQNIYMEKEGVAISYVYTPKKLSIRPKDIKLFPDKISPLFIQKKDEESGLFTPIEKTTARMAMAHDVLKKSIFKSISKDPEIHREFGNIEYTLYKDKGQSNSPFSTGKIKLIEFEPTEDNINYRRFLLKLLQNTDKEVYDARHLLAEWIFNRDLRSLMNLAYCILMNDIYPPTLETLKEMIAMTSKGNSLNSFLENENLITISKLLKDLFNNEEQTSLFNEINSANDENDLVQTISRACVKATTINKRSDTKYPLVIPTTENCLEFAKLITPETLPTIKSAILLYMTSRYGKKKDTETNQKETEVEE